MGKIAGYTLLVVGIVFGLAVVYNFIRPKLPLKIQGIAPKILG
jgi:hypothetical protein